jgi:predicted RNA-binding protein YlxR (DUF448 family)
MSSARNKSRHMSALDDNGLKDRRCIVTGSILPRARMLRFVVGPGRTVVADLNERLPGRGMWLAARANVLAEAASGRHFSRAMRGPVDVPPDLARQVEAGLVSRSVALIGLARRAGAAVAGFEKTRGALKSGTACLLITARDGAADGRRKLGALALGVVQAGGLESAELGGVFGRPAAVHVAVTDQAFADRIARALGRLEGLRGETTGQHENWGAAEIR